MGADGKKCGVKAGFVSGALKSFYPKSSTSTPSVSYHFKCHHQLSNQMPPPGGVIYLTL
jgi:hypothetical protein